MVIVCYRVVSFVSCADISAYIYSANNIACKKWRCRPYTCVYYDEKGRAAMARLQGEFFKALEILENRQPRPDGASVTPLERE